MSDHDPELAGFDGNAAVIDGDVPMHVYERAKEQREQFKRENPDADVPDLAEFIEEIQSDGGGK
jgi:hypothetical protein